MYLGIDLGGTNIAAAAVDENGKILAKESIKTRAERSAREIVEDMGRLCLTVLEKGGYSVDDAEYIGVGTPGTVDRENGVITFSNNLPFLNVPARKMIQEIIDKPVYFENDANCAALGEYLLLEDRGKINCFAAVTLGTGVGSGIIIDGKIFAGGGGAGAELGHVVIETGGKQCTCGRRGCLEQYASANALIEQTREAMAQTRDTIMWEMVERDAGHVSGRTAFAAARQGDRVAQQVIDQYITYVGETLSNLVNLFQPELITISGGISKEGDFLIRPLQKYVEEHFYCRQAFCTEVRAAKLLNDAGIVGAAFLGRQSGK